jgi:transposase
MAVEREGMSRQATARRFGVAPSTVIGWVAQFRAKGHIEPGQMGGHKPKTLSGEHRIWLLQRCKAGDFTLRGLVGELAAERGLKVDYRSVWEFVHAERLSFKKNSSARRAKSSRRSKKTQPVDKVSKPH